MYGMRIFDHLRCDSFRPAFFYRLGSRSVDGGRADPQIVESGLRIAGSLLSAFKSAPCGLLQTLRSLNPGRHVEPLSRTEARTTITAPSQGLCARPSQFAS
jgi:hypothetical protein